MKVCSLFSGIGGIDLGFIQAGFEIVWANEIDSAACKTYRYNLGKLDDLEKTFEVEMSKINHANTDMDFWPLIAARENVLNAGVDLNGFQPVPFDELLANNIRFKEEHRA